MIIVSGTMRIAEADMDKARALALTMSAASEAEEGCGAYGFWEDVGQPGRIRLFEEWESQEAMDAHAASPHFAEFMTGMGTLTVSDFEIHKYSDATKGPLF